MIFAFFFYIAALVMTLIWFFNERREYNASAATHSPQETKTLVTPPSPASVGGQSKAHSITSVILQDGRKRTEREYVDETGQTIKEVIIEDVDEAEPSFEP